jgi:L-2-hydroxyglutarate oxidase LhgO
MPNNTCCIHGSCSPVCHSLQDGPTASRCILQAGADVLCSAAVGSADPSAAGFNVHVTDTNTGEISCLSTRWLINSAGLSAHELAGRVAGLPEQHVPRVWFAKGNYFVAPGPPAFRRLVYPVPEDGGLGAHLTLDLTGQMKFGPDVEWLGCCGTKDIDYSVDSGRKGQFLRSVRQYWPGVAEREVVAGYSGVRAKLSGPGCTPPDFSIQGPHEHGLRGLVNLFGIESPGLTSCLSIAAIVRGMVVQ